jgi:uncharacterized membrane protein YkvA (DUF1232 family)
MAVDDAAILTRQDDAAVRDRAAYKLLALAAGIYLVLPFDAIPDFIPVVGHFDDAIILGLVLGAIRRDWLGALRHRAPHRRALTLLASAVPGCWTLGIRSTRSRDAALNGFRAVMASGEFSEDWFTANIPDWEPIMRELSGRPARLLELGSFEGLSASFLLWRLPQAHVTCVDTFAGFLSTPELPRIFDRNVRRVGRGRVRKLVGPTRAVLPQLVDEGERFDFVYVDASHLALDVLVDAALSWQMLEVGGVVVSTTTAFRVLIACSARRPRSTPSSTSLPKRGNSSPTRGR